MKVNVISESQYFKEKFGGIHIAFSNHVALLRKKNVDVVINSLGKADLVHIHSYGPFALFKLLTAREPKVLITHTVPASLVGSYKGGKLLQKIITFYLKFFYNKADLIIAVSPTAKKDLEKIGVTAKMVVLPNQINSDLFKKDPVLRKKGREKFQFKEHDFVVFGAGRQSPRKGIHDFVSAAKRCPSMKFVWAGGADVGVLNAQTDEIKEIVENPPSNMKFLGTVSYKMMPMLFNMADVVFFPSYQETQGLVIIEGAICGLPIVIRDLPEYRELYEKGYIACQTLDEFCHALEKLRSDKNFYHKQVVEAEQLATQFSDDIIGDKMIAYYQSLLQK